MENNKRRLWILTSIILLGVWIFFAILFLRTAWLCDDAYISFRTVDNAVNGYGLRWNVNERVQAYTHPLWMLLHIPFYALTREMFLTAIFISFGVSMLTIILLTLGIAQNLSQVLIAVSILGFSRAFIDFSSSGLENPMSHLLLVIFMILFLSQKFTLKNLFLLSLIASLATLNRQDCILLYFPPLAYAWWQTENKKQGFILLCLGFIPLILWELFSIIYYGFPFPNTAYAKLGTGLWKIDLIKQGLWYYAFSWKRDFITLLVLFLSLFIPFYQRQKEVWACVIGIILYGFYIIWIGGDFMGGRFFSVPLLLATILLIRYSKLDQLKRGIPAICIFLITSFIQPHVPILTGSSFGKDLSGFKDEHGIGDERMFYFQVASLAHWEKGKPMPCNAFANQGRQYRQANKKITKSHGSVGYRGFFAGHVAHIIDYNALSDPLLARMPAACRPSWRIGHFWRYIPEGYIDSAGGDENRIKDTNLAEFFNHLKIITRGPLFTIERWRDIIKMNLGMYDYLIDKDRYQFPNLKKITYQDLKERITSNESAKIVVPKYGIEIQFDEIKKNDTITIELDSFDTFIILFFNDKNWIARKWIEKTWADPDKATVEPYTKHKIKVPFSARKKGYTAIRVFTYPGDADSTMRDIQFD
ncbi:MAG TPA: hypothetical protein PLA12_10080 [Candidatus Hydrogenedens sp.]|nr:hypothetical protein [Candidatus Hydrogenedens sp.]